MSNTKKSFVLLRQTVSILNEWFNISFPWEGDNDIQLISKIFWIWSSFQSFLSENLLVLFELFVCAVSSTSFCVDYTCFRVDVSMVNLHLLTWEDVLKSLWTVAVYCSARMSCISVSALAKKSLYYHKGSTNLVLKWPTLMRLWSSVCFWFCAITLKSGSKQNRPNSFCPAHSTQQEQQYHEEGFHQEHSSQTTYSYYQLTLTTESQQCASLCRQIVIHYLGDWGMIISADSTWHCALKTKGTPLTCHTTQPKSDKMFLYGWYPCWLQQERQQTQVELMDTRVSTAFLPLR